MTASRQRARRHEISRTGYLRLVPLTYSVHLLAPSPSRERILGSIYDRGFHSVPASTYTNTTKLVRKLISNACRTSELYSSAVSTSAAKSSCQHEHVKNNRRFYLLFYGKLQNVAPYAKNTLGWAQALASGEDRRQSRVDAEVLLRSSVGLSLPDS